MTTIRAHARDLWQVAQLCLACHAQPKASAESNIPLEKSIVSDVHPLEPIAPLSSFFTPLSPRLTVSACVRLDGPICCY